MRGNFSLESIVRKAIVPASVVGLALLSACGYQPKVEPTRTLPLPQVHVATFTPTASPEPTYTPTATATIEPTATPTEIPTQTPVPTEVILSYAWPAAYATPVEACKGEKKIVVDLSEQMTYAVIDYACSGRRAILYSSLSSTGLADSPTPINTEDDDKKDFRIWDKRLKKDMKGPGYDLPDVPFVMYFDYEGDSLHGTYWHKNFGHPMSHGCVNLPNEAAVWFYNWAKMGTKVIVQP